VYYLCENEKQDSRPNRFDEKEEQGYDGSQAVMIRIGNRKDNDL